MKNLKKTLSIFLAIALILSSAMQQSEQIEQHTRND